MSDYEVGDVPRSMSSERVSLLTFIVKCQRVVDVFWRDYSGRRVKYATLQPGANWEINTFETHPWEFRDAKTSDILLATDLTGQPKQYYYPRAWRGEEVTNVYIDIPVYSLRERCLQVVRKIFDTDSIKAADIPRILQSDLLRNSTVDYDIRMQFQPVIQ